MNYLELAQLAGGEIVLVLTALVVLGLDLATARRSGGGIHAAAFGARRTLALAVGSLGGLLAVAWWILGARDGDARLGMFVSDPLIRFVKVVVVGLTVGTLWLSARMNFTVHLGEYVAVVLLGAVGMLLVVSTENVLMLFLALELASLSLYILTAFNKRDPLATEAAIKYFLFGGMAGAFLLFGLSLLYGATGKIEFVTMGEALASQPFSPLILVGLVMVLVGVGFKVAAAPFHFWAPDAYQGAPTPAAGFVATGSKVAAFFIAAKLALTTFAGVAGSANWNGFIAGWIPLVAVVAAVSMVVGNFAALMQQNVKRLLAYSAVAHAGYTLVGIVAANGEGLGSVTFYAVTYAITALGAFGALGLVENASGGSDLEHLRGLVRRSPGLALCLGIFLLSLAGIPPLVGFFGKFYVFLAALKSDQESIGLLWLVGLGTATTCVSFYYYLRVLKAVFVEEGDAASATETASGGLEWTTVVLAATAVVIIGCAPGLLLGPLRGALAAAGW